MSDRPMATRTGSDAELGALAGRIDSSPDLRDGWGKSLRFQGALLPPDVVAVQLVRAQHTRGGVAETGERTVRAWLLLRDIGKAAEYARTSYGEALGTILSSLSAMKKLDHGGAWCDAEDEAA